MGLFLFKNPWPQIACLALVTLSIGLWPHGRKAWASNLFILSLAAGLLLVSWDLCSSRLGPLSNFDFEKNRPELSLVKKTIGHSRIFLRDDIPYPVQTLSGPGTIDLPVNAGWPFGLRTVRGYNAMSLVGVERLYRIPASTFARLMALGAFVTGCDLGPVRGFRQMDWGAMRVYFSTNPASYVFCPSHALFFPDDHEAFLALCRKDFNPMDQVVFSNPLPEGENTRRTDMRYEWVKNDPDEESFDIQMGKPNWAVFSEVNYPGWRAWVDEKESAIVTADTVLRAVYIPAGKHRVCFRFKPAWIPWLGSGGVAWLAGVILFIIYRRKLDLRFSLW